MIQLRHVFKHLGTSLVLDNITLDIEDGTIFGLIGENGAGKSTLLRILAGIYKCDSGTVMLDQQNVFDKPRSKKDIVLIGDDPFLFYHASLHDMKEFYKVWYPQFDESVYQEYIALLHLNEKIAMNNFSKGMKRQAFIVIGLSIAPRYLLLDEAFDGLDPMMRVYFKQAIARRIEEKKMTVIISSHNLREMEDLCDSFGMLRQGVLTTAGDTIDEIGQVHSYQMAFEKVAEASMFQELNVLSIQITSRVVSVVVRGEQEKVYTYLQTLHPLMLEVLPVSLEEIFIYEMEQVRGGSV